MHTSPPSRQAELASLAAVVTEAPSLACAERALVWGSRRASLAGLNADALEQPALLKGIERGRYVELVAAGDEYAARERQRIAPRRVVTPLRRKATNGRQVRIRRAWSPEQGQLFNPERVAA